MTHDTRTSRFVRTELDRRRVWASRYLADSCRMAPQLGLPVHGPQTAKEAGYMEGLPEGFGTSGRSPVDDYMDRFHNGRIGDAPLTTLQAHYIANYYLQMAGPDDPTARQVVATALKFGTSSMRPCIGCRAEGRCLDRINCPTRERY